MLECWNDVQGRQTFEGKNITNFVSSKRSLKYYQNNKEKDEERLYIKLYKDKVSRIFESEPSAPILCTNIYWTTKLLKL